jgi:hypothetical protein
MRFSARTVAAWPAVSLAGSYELLVWLIRISGTARPGPWAEHPRDGAVCRAVAGSAPAAAAGSEQHSRSQRGVPGQARQPADRVAGRPAIPADGQRDDAVPEAGAVNAAAVAAYRLSVQAGNPLSERKLAQLFGRTSRRWARARITDARLASPLPDTPGTPGHDLTARPAHISASGPADKTPPFTQVPSCRANTGRREVH